MIEEFMANLIMSITSIVSVQVHLKTSLQIISKYILAPWPNHLIQRRLSSPRVSDGLRYRRQPGASAWRLSVHALRVSGELRAAPLAAQPADRGQGHVSWTARGQGHRQRRHWRPEYETPRCQQRNIEAAGDSRGRRNANIHLDGSCSMIWWSYYGWSFVIQFVWQLPTSPSRYGRRFTS